VPQYREMHAIETVPITEESVLHLSRLPKHHKDPFDRVLVCQAIASGMTILTPDELIRQYPVKTLW
jgi:PIN domain nuclease of toxin-antitoxin system